MTAEEKAVAMEDVERVWKAWRSRQRRPGCWKLTLDREVVIRSRMVLGYDAEDFEKLFRYAWEARNPETAWWHGQNPRRKTYLGLTNLLVEAKLGDRMGRAAEWCEEEAEREQGIVQIADHQGRARALLVGGGGATDTPAPAQPATSLAYWRNRKRKRSGGGRALMVPKRD